LPEVQHTNTLIERADSVLKKANETWDKNDYFSKSPEEKVKAFPKFAGALSYYIDQSAIFIKSLNETEWKTAELQARAEIIKQQLERVRTRLRQFLRQEYVVQGQKAMTNVLLKYSVAKEEYQKGNPLNYVRALEEYTNLRLAHNLTRHSTASKMLKFVFNADIEDNPETYSWTSGSEEVQTIILTMIARRLKRYRLLLEKGEKTSEKIIERENEQSLIKELEKDLASRTFA